MKESSLIRRLETFRSFKLKWLICSLNCSLQEHSYTQHVNYLMQELNQTEIQLQYSSIVLSTESKLL